MKPFYLFVLTVFLPLAAVAQQATPPEAAGPAPVAAAVPMEPPVFLDASGVTMAEFLWLKRPVLVFAENPNDPNFIRQLELLHANPAALEERDVVVITDTDPANPSFFRLKFRPRGFSLVLMDKDGVTTLRKPLPWDVREITRAIDKFPLARQELLERYPSGR